MGDEKQEAVIVTLPARDIQPVPKDFRFWTIIGVINLCYFLALLEATSISTALPTISSALHGNDFIWVGSAFNIAATAFMPMSGGLAQIFGRRPILLASLTMFGIGSLVCGVARSMNMLIAGRAVQGSGAAGLMSVSSIILSDIVALKERGAYNGLLQLTWCIAAGIGPAIGGALARSGAWRWLFYLNLPLVGIAIVLTVMFLHLKSPRDHVWLKLRAMDWVGSFLIISSSVSVAIALTWAGLSFGWSSPQVLVPLCVGLAGMVGFFVYEVRLCERPIVPLAAISNITSLSGYFQIFFAAVPFVALVFYLPVYFQACKGSSPLRSGIELFPLAFSVCPFSIFTGLSVTRTGRYRPQAWVGWVIIVLSMGLFGSVESTTRVSLVLGYQIIAGIGFGIVYSSTYFPVLAPLPLTVAAHSLAFFAFVRQFAGIWSVTIGGAILQNTIQTKLPSEFTAQFPGGAAVFYEVIAEIDAVDEPLRSEVRAAFGDALKLTWLVLTGVSGLGLISSLVMRGLPLHTTTDKDWGVKEKSGEGEVGTSSSSDGAN
ncbi:Efflux pump FUS6 [Hypsizygus marmoreus]|uniref:Efflux pump FUS6 n=1 Tax=Hypsizygus marmoreus TaxID=39966 RepID=A0A369K0D8_HYPMA|nr:Efflux pump FUS6 [Hypsizygus marmoreus]